ncbi:hydrogenase maturation peptidase HycI [Dickeya dianthicola]|uniref:Hydrogenase maturation peptidase HycI n=1 Tax=Dickeya dianthicola TaxID=204039 RepID=A0AAW4LDD7_9GAMM|nr:hydrogenase maturation peptidase HycI [Dickeya dianthicola]ATO32386.1 Coenzyme F420 hydrogenase maturation protease [Dickeya dianthicola RNS04.9]MBT1427493.1 hydrogenase maturation peptidase HycI [Dickeya dianthicola]MBT1431563.1 hydrogenase maturation peptidase HycI [Dickeya dianthicola]MBT1459008.1 hydrogenase maturation peptidase HycI [Dickeya dianthicola]MBT1488204.1 hydrogenase maturation peptidase HycI [Dickeya dianthicola]
MTEHPLHTEAPLYIENMVLTVGNTLMGDDGAGPLLAERMSQQPVAGWSVIDGGAIPENAAHTLRELKPRRLLVVDATDMGLAPGEIRIVDPERIAEDMLMNTHSLPLNYLIDSLKEDIPEVIFVGIQPALVAFYFPISPEVTRAVDTLYQRLSGWEENGGFEMLA